MVDPNRAIRERLKRSIGIDCQSPAAKVPLVDDFTKIQGTELVISQEHEDYPSTMDVLVPESEKMIGSAVVLRHEFQGGIVSRLQLFLSQSVSEKYKLHYGQLMAFLLETTDDSYYEEFGIREITKELYGGHQFVLASDVLNMFHSMRTYSYNQREIWLISQLRAKTRHTYVKQSNEQKLHVAQNYLWYLLERQLPTDEGFNKRATQLIDQIDTLARLASELQ